MSQAAPPAPPARPAPIAPVTPVTAHLPQARAGERPPSLRRRISLQLVRIMRTYVILITSVVMVIMVAAGGVYWRTNINHQRDLVLTKIGTELTNTSVEMQALATAPVVWTGLTDSFGREAYLEPLLARFNRGNERRLILLDYKGRLFLAPGGVDSKPLLDLPEVKAAVLEGRDGAAVHPDTDGTTHLMLVRRVISPVAQSPVGFLVVSMDALILLRDLRLAPDLQLAFALGDSPLFPEPRSGGRMTASGEGLVDVAGMKLPLRIWIGEDIYEALGVLLGTVAVIGAMGWWSIRSVVAWSRRFAATTTRRYEQLLLDCQRLLAGEPMTAVGTDEDGQRDELSEVTDALTAMLGQQKQLTDELRKTSVVFSTSAEGILVTDNNGAIVDVNPALSAMTGYLRVELLGKQAGTLYRSVGRDDTSRAMAQSLDQDGRWSGETSFLARNGRVIPTTVSISRIRDADGVAQGNVTIITDVSRLKAAENQLRDLAYRDGLTGLPNFRRMSDEVQALLTRAAGGRQTFAVLFFDMDQLKFVNDNYGHEVGDLVIKSLAAHLRSTLPRGHLLCRRSGDEFIAVVDLPGPESADYLQRILERINPLQVTLPTGKLAVSATIGLSRYPQDGNDWQTLMICADVAMNEAKQRQRGTLAWFDAALGERAYRRRLIQTRLAQAIQERVIEVHYQPEVDMRSGQVIGFEALARWRDAELGMVSPAEFVPIAEEAHLLDALSLLVMEIVLRDKPRLRTRFPAAHVAFNVAPQALLGSRLLDYLQGRRLVQPTVVDGLEIELTESQIASGEAYLLGQLQALTAMGVQVVIDDFGTGYSSLGRLTQFPISRLKIDRSFVAGLEVDRQGKIARLVIQLARTLNFEVTAEGVETESQRDALLGMGCIRAQGWLYAKAMPVDQVEALAQRLEAGANPQTAVASPGVA